VSVLNHTQSPASTIFRPILAGATLTERLIGCLGAALCLGLTMTICANLPLQRSDLPAIVAPLGASAVLVFAVPSSPLAQPWSVVGGNTISALIGVAVFRLVPQPAVAVGLAVGLAILVMSLLRCLHPPGGAAALTAVIGGSTVHAMSFGFAFVPVALNSIALVSLAMAFHRATGRTYPHEPAPSASARPSPDEAALLREDIDAALAAMHESFDIDPVDLHLLLAEAETQAQARRKAAPQK
jgi:CBS domain-containing membrane protein